MSSTYETQRKDNQEAKLQNSSSPKQKESTVVARKYTLEPKIKK